MTMIVKELIELLSHCPKDAEVNVEARFTQTDDTGSWEHELHVYGDDNSEGEDIHIATFEDPLVEIVDLTDGALFTYLQELLREMQQMSTAKNEMLATYATHWGQRLEYVVKQLEKIQES